MFCVMCSAFVLLQPHVWLNGEVIKALEAVAAKQKLQDKEVLRSPIDNYYMTDSISRASAIMAKCVIARREATNA